MPVVVPVGIHCLTCVDGEDLCSSFQSYFRKPPCSAADFQNLFSRKIPGPVSLSDKARFRKLHPIDRVKLSSGVFVPLKTERGGCIVCRDKAGYKLSYLESMLSRATNQKSSLNSIPLFFAMPFKRKLLLQPG